MDDSNVTATRECHACGNPLVGSDHSFWCWQCRAYLVTPEPAAVTVRRPGRPAHEQAFMRGRNGCALSSGKGPRRPPEAELEARIAYYRERAEKGLPLFTGAGPFAS